MFRVPGNCKEEISSLISRREFLYLSRAEVENSGGLGWESLVNCMISAYATHGSGNVILPKAEYLRYADRSSYDRIIPLYGYLGDPFNVAGLKQICSSLSSAKYGFPRASGITILNEPLFNRPFAIMDATAISAARTAAVSALALRELCPADSRVIGMIGCGELAEAHLNMILALFGVSRFEFVAFDIDQARLTRFVHLAQADGAVCQSASSAFEVVSRSNIVLPMTTAEEPYIRLSWLRPNCLYCAVSLLDAELEIYRGAQMIIVDDLKQCLNEGRPLEQLARDEQLDMDRVIEIGKWLQTRQPKPENSGKPIVFNSMGTIIADLAAALQVFCRASERHLGVRLPL